MPSNLAFNLCFAVSSGILPTPLWEWGNYHINIMAKKMEKIVSKIISQKCFCSINIFVYCYTFLYSVSLSIVCRICLPCSNRLMDSDAIWQVCLCGPVTPCVTDRGCWPCMGSGDLEAWTPGQNIYEVANCRRHRANRNDKLLCFLPNYKFLWCLFGNYGKCLMCICMSALKHHVSYCSGLACLLRIWHLRQLWRSRLRSWSSLHWNVSTWSWWNWQTLYARSLKTLVISTLYARLDCLLQLYCWCVSHSDSYAISQICSKNVVAQMLGCSWLP